MSEPDLTGQTLDGRYRITGLLGKGGMGHVYEGLHVVLGRRIAIKTLHPRLADERRFRERFLREAKSASSIQHPNVVQIMDFGDTPNGSVYFVMEHLEGRDLGALLREQGALPWARARGILLQAVRALGAAHARGVIHRDIKPANCFLTGTGPAELVKLLDFGIAKPSADAETSEDDPPLTGTGEVFGTATYMAPEQARGEPLDARSDVYSLGVMAYEMLTGRVPFKGSNSLHIITRHLRERPKPPRELEPGIPPAVERLVLRAMAKDPKQRFASMLEVEAALQAIPADAAERKTIPRGTASARPSSMLPVSEFADTAALVPVPAPTGAPVPRSRVPTEPAPDAKPVETPVEVPSASTSGIRTLVAGSLSAPIPSRASAAEAAPGDRLLRTVKVIDLPPRATSQPQSIAPPRESTHPPPGQADHPTAPSLLMTLPSGTGSLRQATGLLAAETSPHPLVPEARPAPTRRLALMLGAITLVSSASIAATLLLLDDEELPAAVETIDPPPGDTTEPGTQPSGPDVTPPSVTVPEPIPSPGATSVTAPSEDPPPVVPLEATRPPAPPADAPPTIHHGERGQASPELRGDAASRHPTYLTQTCVDRRARAKQALGTRAWRDVLSETKTASCWPPAEQDERRSMRVMAYLDLGEFEKCITTGRDARDEQTRSDVERCKELSKP